MGVGLPLTSFISGLAAIACDRNSCASAGVMLAFTKSRSSFQVGASRRGRSTHAIIAHGNDLQYPDLPWTLHIEGSPLAGCSLG